MKKTLIVIGLFLGVSVLSPLIVSGQSPTFGGSGPFSEVTWETLFSSPLPHGGSRGSDLAITTNGVWLAVDASEENDNTAATFRSHQTSDLFETVTTNNIDTTSGTSISRFRFPRVTWTGGSTYDTCVHARMDEGPSRFSIYRTANSGDSWTRVYTEEGLGNRGEECDIQPQAEDSDGNPSLSGTNGFSVWALRDTSSSPAINGFRASEKTGSSTWQISNLLEPVLGCFDASQDYSIALGRTQSPTRMFIAGSGDTGGTGVCTGGTGDTVDSRVLVHKCSNSSCTSFSTTQMEPPGGLGQFRGAGVKGAFGMDNAMAVWTDLNNDQLRFATTSNEGTDWTASQVAVQFPFSLLDADNNFRAFHVSSDPTQGAYFGVVVDSDGRPILYGTRDNGETWGWTIAPGVSCPRRCGIAWDQTQQVLGFSGEDDQGNTVVLVGSLSEAAPAPDEFSGGIKTFITNIGFRSPESEFLFSIILIGLVMVMVGIGTKLIGESPLRGILTWGAGVLTGIFCVTVFGLELWMFIIAVVLGGVMMFGFGPLRGGFRTSSAIPIEEGPVMNEADEESSFEAFERLEETGELEDLKEQARIAVEGGKP